METTAAVFGSYVLWKFAACGERRGNSLTGKRFLILLPTLERGVEHAGQAEGRDIPASATSRG